MTRMDCGEVRELLQPYDDDELPAAERDSVARHLEGCAECAAALRDLQALRSRIRAAGSFPVPPGLEVRLKAAIGASRAEPPQRSLRGHVAIAASYLAAAVLGAVLAYLVLTNADARTALAREVATAHARSLLTGRPTDVASADTHTVKPWFAGKLPFAPEVADLARRGFPLSGARVDYLLDQPTAALVYERRQHRITLFIVPDRHLAGAGSFQAVRNGYNIAAWSEAGFAYLAASDLNAAELAEFAVAFKSRGGG